MTPTSFVEENMSEWGSWVLEHGLPVAPEVLELGEAVPVARWVGYDVAGVLFLTWQWSEVENIEPSVSNEAYLYVRSGAGWRELEGSIGGSHWRGPALGLPDIPSEYVHLGQKGSIRQGTVACAAVIGEVGTRARHLRVNNARESEVNPIESRVGLFIACFDPSVDTLVEISDNEDHVLSRHSFDVAGGESG
jgi:hypothetical protein